MIGAKEAWEGIRAKLDPEKDAEAIKALDAELGSFPEGHEEFAAVRLAIDGDGMISYSYRKDVRVSDRNLALALLQTSQSMLQRDKPDKKEEA